MCKACGGSHSVDRGRRDNCHALTNNIPSTHLPPPLICPHPQAEEALSKLVVSKAVTVKIDRPAGVVTIGQKPAPEDVLNAWASNIGKLLGLVDKAGQQIQKEAMVHKVPIGGAA